MIILAFIVLCAFVSTVNALCSPPVKYLSLKRLKNGVEAVFSCHGDAFDVITSTCMYDNNIWLPNPTECVKTSFKRRKIRQANVGNYHSLKRRVKEQRLIRQGILRTEIEATTPALVKVYEGNVAYLMCRVINLGTYSLTWKHNGIVIAIDGQSMILDTRLNPTLEENTGNYMLEIRQVRQSDAGLYSCQVNAKPPEQRTVTLQVFRKEDKIPDENTNAGDTSLSGELEELKANLSSLWKEVRLLKEEVALHLHLGHKEESHDQIVAENEAMHHEHDVHHHLIHDHHDHESHHDERLLRHLEEVHHHDNDSHDQVVGNDAVDQHDTHDLHHPSHHDIYSHDHEQHAHGTHQDNVHSHSDDHIHDDGHGHYAHGGHSQEDYSHYDYHSHGRIHGSHGHHGYRKPHGHDGSHRHGGLHSHNYLHDPHHGPHSYCPQHSHLGHYDHDDDHKHASGENYDESDAGSHKSHHHPSDSFSAHCHLAPNAELPESDMKGHVLITLKKDGASNMRFELDVKGFPPNPTGNYGFHVHANPITDGKCGTAGGHFNPHGTLHGGPNDDVRHVGDLGNVRPDKDGYLKTVIEDRMTKFSGSDNIIGKSLVIHSDEDDFGKGGFPASLITGNSGTRLACCTIEAHQDTSKTRFRFKG